MVAFFDFQEGEMVDFFSSPTNLFLRLFQRIKSCHPCHSPPLFSGKKKALPGWTALSIYSKLLSIFNDAAFPWALPISTVRYYLSSTPPVAD